MAVEAAWVALSAVQVLGQIFHKVAVIALILAEANVRALDDFLEVFAARVARIADRACCVAVLAEDAVVVEVSVVAVRNAEPDRSVSDFLLLHSLNLDRALHAVKLLVGASAPPTV